MRKSITEDALFKKGARVRKAVLGDSYLKKRLAATNIYTEPFEEFTTKAAWGLVWSRPGLSRRVRSFLNLGMLVALAQPEELRLHIRGALGNGITRMEIAETILHTAVYCGVPRATAARRIMLAVFAELDAEVVKPAPVPTPTRKRKR